MRLEGVRIIHPNGAVTLCEVVPSHVEHVFGEDIQMWALATPLRPGDNIEWDDIPLGTGITGPTAGITGPTEGQGL
jgi:hypothetical protein